ncbi:hypothetical protein ACWDZ4_22200 [Streptomyces sp. NPDC003016]
MSTGTRRGWAAAATFALAAAVNVVTGILTQQWSAAWWLTLAVLVIVGGGLQAWVTLGERPTARQRVDNTVVGGSVTQRLTEPGEQSVSDSRLGGGLTQRQGEEADGT